MVVDALTRDTMPSGEGDLSIEGHGIEPIPAAARYGSVYRLFTVWFTPNLVPAAFALGIIVAGLGLGFIPGLLAVLVGNVIGGGIVAILSTIGPKVGLGQMPITRLSFGKSIVVPGLINWLSTIAWDAINAFFGAYAIQVITGGAVPFWLGLLVVIICQAALSVVGYEAIHTFEKYAAIGLAILFAIVTIALLPRRTSGPRERPEPLACGYWRPRSWAASTSAGRCMPRTTRGTCPPPLPRAAWPAIPSLGLRCRPSGSRCSASRSLGRPTRPSPTRSTRSTPCWAAGC